VVDEAALDDNKRRIAVIQKEVTDLQPGVVCMSSIDNSYPDRMEAFRVVRGATAKVATALAYQMATTRIDYQSISTDALR
jgi:hypothetical protein|tara:strand:+ start:449 stop:688 length:240 start_codon:yes stop_codon:yes gene_type:complete